MITVTLSDDDCVITQLLKQHYPDITQDDINAVIAKIASTTKNPWDAIPVFLMSKI